MLATHVVDYLHVVTLSPQGNRIMTRANLDAFAVRVDMLEGLFFAIHGRWCLDEEPRRRTSEQRVTKSGQRGGQARSKPRTDSAKFGLYAGSRSSSDPHLRRM